MSTSATVASVHGPGVRCSNDVPKTTLDLVSGVLMTWPKATGASVPMSDVRFSKTWPRLQVPLFQCLVSGVVMTWPRLQVPAFMFRCSN